MNGKCRTQPAPRSQENSTITDTDGAKMFDNVGTQQGGIDKSPLPGQHTKAVQDEHINSRQ
jgi:hypothetical protein